MKDPDSTLRLLKLIDQASYDGNLSEEIDADAAWYHDDPARAYELRCLYMQTAALGAIAMLLLRSEAWQRY